MGEPFVSTPTGKPPEDRLDSWKEIAAYLNRDVTTVQRWEKREGMPVHRHLHDRIGTVYASQAELDAWVRGRNARPAEGEKNDPSPDAPATLPPQPISASPTKQKKVCLTGGSDRMRAGCSGRASGSRAGSISGETRSPMRSFRRLPTSRERSRLQRCRATAIL